MLKCLLYLIRARYLVKVSTKEEGVKNAPNSVHVVCTQPLIGGSNFCSCVYLLGFWQIEVHYEQFTAKVNAHFGFGKNCRSVKISVPVLAKNSDFGRSLYIND